MNKLIVDTLSPLGVPVAALRYNRPEPTYIVFNEYTQNSQMNADDVEVMTRRLYQLDIFSDGNLDQLADEVRSRMKEAGFGRTNESETYDEDMEKFRKMFRFTYIEK